MHKRELLRKLDDTIARLRGAQRVVETAQNCHHAGLMDDMAMYLDSTNWAAREMVERISKSQKTHGVYALNHPVQLKMEAAE
jgi:hypothetical protein